MSSRLMIALVLLGVISMVSSFAVSGRTSTVALSMKVKSPSVGNLPRKMKRKLIGIKSENFDTILTDEFDSYMKNEASPAVHARMMKDLQRKARALGVKVKEGFGVKAAVVRPSLLEAATSAGNFGTLLKAAEAAGLAGALSGSDMITVLAPNDEAFAKIDGEALEALMADKEKLAATLKGHIVSGFIKSTKFGGMKDEPPTTLAETPLKISVERSGDVKFGEAGLVAADTKCSNGMLHVIDTVIMSE